MTIFFFLAFLLTALIFVISIFLLLFKSKRKIAKKGLIVGAVGSFISIAGFGAGIEAENKPGFIARNNDDAIVTADVEPKTTEEIEPQISEKWKTLGFANIKEYAEAAKIGMSNPKAYALRRDKEVIKPFCTYADKSYKISDQANARVQKAGDNQTKIQKAFKWEEDNQVALRAELLKQIPLTDSEITILSGAMHWQLYCDAYDKNLEIIDRDLAERSNEEWAEKAGRGISAYFIWRLENTTSTYFDNQRYSAVNCRNEKIDGLFIVACKLRSLSASSQTIYFVTARGLGGKVLAAPLKHRELVFDTSERVFEAYGEPKFYLSGYVARDYNYSRIVGIFKP